MPNENEAARKRRTEIILRQIESLPTLPSVATKLLALTSTDDSDVREVIDLIAADQALTARVLSMCQSAEMGVRSEVRTIEHAVRLLGFTIIRNTVLSVKVLDLFAAGDDPAANAARDDPAAIVFQPSNFWRHGLSVATAAELIAQAHPRARDLDPGAAFICGLLHDIGKIALYHVLPKSYNRVAELTDLNQADICEFERRIIGMDHQTAGKHLAEQWGLPEQVHDCIWLHGSDYGHLPSLEHRRMVGLVSLADLVARRNHLGYSGNFRMHGDQHAMATELDLNPDAVTSITGRLHDQVQQRSNWLGLDDQPTQALFMQSIQNANAAIARLNGTLQRRSRNAAQMDQAVKAISAFHQQTQQVRSMPHLLDAVAANAASVFGEGVWAMLYEPQASDAAPLWLLATFDRNGQPQEKQWLEPAGGASSLSSLLPANGKSTTVSAAFPWLTEHLGPFAAQGDLRAMPLACSNHGAVALIHDRADLTADGPFKAVVGSWSAGLAAAIEHETARTISEQLAEAGRTISQSSAELVEKRAMAHLGELAAGAAHEMNNPLAIISGRSQLLTHSLAANSREREAAQTIVSESHKLSDLITTLRLLADPPRANRRPVDIGNMVHEVVERVRRDLGDAKRLPECYVKVQAAVRAVLVDPEQLNQAVTELLTNAFQAAPKGAVQLLTRVDTEMQMLILVVSDDGPGMDEHTLEHATDPFFSARKSGRSVGLGLARASQWAKAHGGRLKLRSIPGKGTRASIIIPLEEKTAATPDTPATISTPGATANPKAAA